MKSSSKILIISDSMMANNTYLICKNHDCVLIDPSFNTIKIQEYLNKNDLKLQGIILTHGHYDHVGDSFMLAEKYNCQVYIGQLEENVLLNYNYAKMLGGNLVTDKNKITFINQDKLTIGNFVFSIYFTPGHTIGSICILYENYLFTGDLIFSDSVGRTDLYSGNEQSLVESIKMIVGQINDDTLVYPGHNDVTTIKNIKHLNRYVKSVIKSTL